MIFVLLGALAVSLVGCEPGPDPVPPVDVRPHGARLETGSYAVRVESVQSRSCDRPSPVLDYEELVGELLRADFLADGEAAVMDLEGVVLFGTQARGVVSLAGAVDVGGAEPVPDTGTDHEESDADTDSDSDADSGCAEVEVEDTGVVEERPGCEEGEEPPARPDRPPRGGRAVEVTLDLVVREPGRAQGQLGLDDLGCFIVFGVSLLPDHGDEAVEVEEDEPPSDERDDEDRDDEPSGGAA